MYTFLKNLLTIGNLRRDTFVHRFVSLIGTTTGTISLAVIDYKKMG